LWNGSVFGQSLFGQSFVSIVKAKTFKIEDFVNEKAFKTIS